MQLPAVGEVFEGRYELRAVLGEGAFGCVFRAFDLAVGREVALKVLAPRGGDYSTLTAARFLRETRLLASLQDPHTITMFDSGESPGGLLYMACELVDGEELKATIEREGRLSAAKVEHILRQLLGALREAHSRGLLHRDIKPANILVYEYDGDPYQVKLVDFGLAKSVDADATQITREGAIAGTPRYMSPEQVLAGELGPQSDIYSLGLVAYEMLTGEPAIDGKDMKELLKKQVMGPETRVPEQAAPSGLRRVIERMAHRDPDVRYPDAGVALRELTMSDAGRDSAPLNIPQTTPSLGPALEPEARSTSRGTLAIAAGALGIVCFIIVASLLPTSSDSGTDAASERATNLKQVIATPPARRSIANVEDAGLRPTGEADLATADLGAADASGPTKTGCGKPRKPGSRDIWDNEGLDSLQWTRQIPKGYDPARRHPMIVLFHGYNRTPRNLLVHAGVARFADEHQIVVIAPHAPRRSFKNMTSPKPFARFVSRTLTELCIDEDRVFVLSHDGEGAALTACEPWVDAIASSSHRPIPEYQLCEGRPVPRIAFAPMLSGHADVNGKSRCRGADTLPLDAFESMWRKRNQCRSGEPEVWAAHDESVCTTWRCEGAPFVACRIDGGHDWKDMALAWWDPLGCGGPQSDFPYMSTIWRFFEESVDATADSR